MPVPFARPVDLIERGGDERAQRAAAALADGVEAKRADGQRDTVVRLAVGDADQLEAAAAEVADDAVGPGDAGDDAERGAARLGLAVDHLDLEPACLAHRVEEALRIGRLPDGSGGDGAQVADAHVAREQREAGERGDGDLHRAARQPPVGGEPAAEPGHDLLVEHDRRRPCAA